MRDQDTIFALSTAPGRAGIAVVRISGPGARGALRALGGPGAPAPRRACLTLLRRPEDDRPLDQALCLWFPGPRSFTGEDLAELHLHGGPAVVAAGLEALAGLDGLRPAEPGEFTRRAFDNGKLDLSEVEGLADLIAAETEAQRHQALRQMSGALARLMEDWRRRLIGALARLEAAIDFPDEELPDELGASVRREAGDLSREIARSLDDGHAGERLRAGLRVAILGAPNVGKSSLLNAIARRDAAIVSETAGTTRDVIEVHLDLGGYPVTLLDTAGLRAAQPSEPVEAEGMRRARAAAAEADLRLVICDVRDWPELGAETEPLLGERALLLLNKVDLAPPPADAGVPFLAISARDGRGLDDLLRRLESEALARLGASGAAPSLTRLRHRRALEDAHGALLRAREGEAAELVAEDLRLAARALGRVAGRVDIEEVLDALFAEFCIGK